MSGDAVTTHLKSRWLHICLLVILALSLVPVAQAWYSGGSLYDAASVSYLDTYYSPMVREVVNGNPLMGNPYFFEYRKEVAPAFMMPFWIAAVPQFLGFSQEVSHILNFTLWSLVFGALLYVFFRRLELTEYWAVAGTIVCYLPVYVLIIRPVSMQIVYPFFLLLMLAFILWWRNQNWRTNTFLAITIALTFYDYTYLWQITTVFLALSFCGMLFMRDWQRVRSALVVGLSAIVIIIPMIYLTLAQTHHPYYWETMTRIGLGTTYLPAAEAVLAALRVFLVGLLGYALWKWAVKDSRGEYTSLAIQYGLLGIAMVIASASNMITGMELETASHMARFISIWLFIAFVLTLYVVWSARTTLRLLEPYKIITLGSLFVLFGFSLTSYSGNPLALVKFNDVRPLVTEARAYRTALQALDALEAEPHVIWTDPNSLLAEKIPLYTKHYMLYTAGGLLQLVPTDEVHERYLTAGALSDLTLEHISKDVAHHSGAGPAYDIPHMTNRKAKYCRALRLEMWNIQCGELVEARTLSAGVFSGMYERYKSEIQPNLQIELAKFQVAYVMKDIKLDSAFHPERLKNIEEVYSDGRFVIYKLN